MRIGGQLKVDIRIAIKYGADLSTLARMIERGEI